MRRIFYVFAVLSLLSLQALPARAQTAPTPSVFISEINWAGSSISQADEWIELYNPSSQSVDLSGWVLTGSASSGESLAIAEGTVIEPSSTLLIANYDLGEKSTLTVEPDLVTASLSLSNSSQEIILATVDGTVVDRVGDGGKPEAGSSNPVSSMERDLSSLAWNSATASTGLSDANQMGTPGSVGPVAPVITAPEETAAAPAEVAEAPVVEYELTSDQLANCYALFAAETEPVDEETSSEPLSEVTVSMPEQVTESEEVTSPTESSNDEPVIEPVENISAETAPTAYAPGSVRMNEFVSDPQDGDEWVELYNASDTVVDLSGWTIVEGSGKVTDLPTELLATARYLVVSPIKGNLNNGGDSITLFDAAGTQIDTLTYGGSLQAPSKGESLARSPDDTWLITSPTPSAQNAFNNDSYEQATTESTAAESTDDSQDEYETVSPTESDSARETNVVSSESKIYTVVDVAEPSSQQIKEADKQTTTSSQAITTLEGVVTATPDTFGSQIAFIDGMQLYFYHADWPTLSLGDVVRVSGEPSIAWDESRLKIASAEDLQVVRSGSIEPQVLSIEEVFSQDIGSLVQMSGDVLSIDGKALTLSDDASQIEVIANERTGMSWSELGASAYTMTGIVRTRGGEVQLYVRDWNDVKEVEEAVVDISDADSTDLAGVSVEADNGFPWTGAVLMGVSTSAVVYWIIKFKLSGPFTQPLNS